jgi:hypothetical protein
MASAKQQTLTAAAIDNERRESNRFQIGFFAEALGWASSTASFSSVTLSLSAIAAAPCGHALWIYGIAIQT